MDTRFLSATALRYADASDSSPAERPTDPSFPLRGVHVLVVDDDAENREAIQELLEDRGSRITTAASVSDALEKFEHEVPDVLLSDIGMPGEDGLDLIRRVRARPKSLGGAVPAAALTGHTRVEDRHDALCAGFMEHVPKPVDPDELIALVSSLARMAA
ncbi:response regulator [Pendulispora rubella]|uniref:Response regulator n=1 Tax=Pendulispora rubella TaxID=2741070 RepID=A0ABZ2LFR7_9BACT